MAKSIQNSGLLVGCFLALMLSGCLEGLQGTPKAVATYKEISQDGGLKIQFDASLSASLDGDTLRYEWTQISGPSIVLENADTPTPSFEIQKGYVYEFKLTVYDSEGLSDSTIIQIDKRMTASSSQCILMVRIKGQGRVIPSGDVYEKGTELVLKAQADDGWMFDHWEGDLNGIDDQCSITMDTDKDITAVFIDKTTEIKLSRVYHTASLLPDGRVLVVGGQSSGKATSTCEIYDPETKIWSVTGSLSGPRYRHSVVVLKNNKVLVIGGWSGSKAWRYDFLSTCELYDSETGTWTETGSLSIARRGHSATLLPDGRVLVAGGYIDYDWNLGGDIYTATCEIYDPDTGDWTRGQDLPQKVHGHEAILMPNGKVLVTGGDTGDYRKFEEYNPEADSWTNVGLMAKVRFNHTMSLLPNSRVLVAGGYTYPFSNAYICEVYDSVNQTWSEITPMSCQRRRHTATVLPDDKVLVVGGLYSSKDTNEELSSGEIYDPSSNTWSMTTSMSRKRYEHTATLLQNGKVLVIGGTVEMGGDRFMPSEIYDPETQTWTKASGTE